VRACIGSLPVGGVHQIETHSVRAIALGLSAALLLVLALSLVMHGASAGAAHLAGAVASAKPKAEVLKAAGSKVGRTVEKFRSLLGPDNGGGPGGKRNGRREINWDAVPDEFAAPHALPANFFNAAEAPRARGALLTTPGDHVAVSADSDNPDGAAVRFGDINPGYPSQFSTFSPERLFSPIGSNVVNLKFRVPGTSTPGMVRGFGAVYTDIDRRENTAFEYFRADGRSLGKFNAPVANKGLSFLGVVFRKAIVARVRIEYGSGKLGPNDSKSYDAAVMDDFLYGEPRPRR
jgi:hypothetical protein